MTQNEVLSTNLESVRKENRKKITSSPYASSVSGLTKAPKTKKKSTPKRTVVK